MMAEKGEEEEWAERSVRTVNRAFPPVEFSTWAVCERLLPQAYACAELIKQMGLRVSRGRAIALRGWHHLFERSRYTDAEPFYKRAVTIREKAHGAKHPDLAWTLQALARALPRPGSVRRGQKSCMGRR